MTDKHTILYVDDEFTNLLLFEEIFNEWFNVIVVDSGPGALQILENMPEIKVVISDMKMPLMNGIEFISIAKGKYPEKVFYILTGFDINKEISEAIISGIILRYFQKPLQVDEIYYSLSKSMQE
jgi:DNA-binding NtrC family response regulator